MRRVSFSALQRAENFSIVPEHQQALGRTEGFSALQRAENFSIRRITFALLGCERFSALQRAENFSIPTDDVARV